MRRLLYFINQAFASLRGSLGISLLAAGTIAATLLVAAMYAMALQNLENLALVWGRTATLSAYLNEDVPPEGGEAVRQRVALLPTVAHAALVSPKEALERFRARGREAAALVADVTEDALPPSIEIGLRPGFADLQAVEQLARDVATVPGISSVDYGQQEFDRLKALLEVLRYGGLGAGILILLATAFIVSNTIRLTVYARRDEIGILRLVGATRWFVRMPFLIEGGLWGLAGGSLAVLLMWLAHRLLAERLSIAIADVVGGLSVSLFDPTVALAVLAAGLGLGVFGSAFAVGRFLGVEEE
jgi:cell division transport system permease protein